tara:strand:+ start:259 stop:531 length:273 start_codon:yes stop_codon:yes gene_type:complete
MNREELKRLGYGRQAMKNNDSNWSLHYKLSKIKKYKNNSGIELNLNNKDTTSLLIKEIIKKAIKMIGKEEKEDIKCFLIKNFDIQIGEIK